MAAHLWDAYFVLVCRQMTCKLCSHQLLTDCQYPYSQLGFVLVVLFQGVAMLLNVGLSFHLLYDANAEALSNLKVGCLFVCWFHGMDPM